MPPASPHALDLKIPPVALWIGFAAILVVLARVFPAANVPFPGHRLMALAAALGGGLIMAAGVLAFRRAKTTVNPLAPHTSSAMVTAGIYRYIRNPMYLGMALALAGVALWTASVPGGLLVPVFGAYLSRFQIQPEERALMARFGPAFEAYCARVRRWL